MRAAGLVTAVRTLGQGVVARARALATSGPSSQSAPRTAMSACGPAEEVDEGVERHGADWQGIKEPYQLELMPSMDAIRPWGHHAIRMKDAFWPWMAASCWTIQMPTRIIGVLGSHRYKVVLALAQLGGPPSDRVGPWRSGDCKSSFPDTFEPERIPSTQCEGVQLWQ